MKAVFVTGPSRSGTSLISGLLHAHGVWFGPCIKPRSINPRGFFESTFVKERIKNRDFSNFAEHWDRWRNQHGASELWGVKTGPQYYHLFQNYRPLIVVTDRPEAEIMASRARIGFTRSEGALNNARRAVDLLPAHIKIKPGSIINGDYGALEVVLNRLGLELDPQRCAGFIDRRLWSGKA